MAEPTLTVIATAGAANANSYVTLDEAKAIMVGRPQTMAWDAATDATKNKAIVWATALLDDCMEWGGLIWQTTQALRWPRSGLADRDLRVINGQTIPTLLKRATAELANYLIQRDRTATPDVLGLGFDVGNVQGVAVTVNRQQVLDIIPDYLILMLEPFADPNPRAGGGLRTVGLQRT